MVHGEHDRTDGRGTFGIQPASRSGRADDARRARLILLPEAGHTWAAIRDKLDCNDAFIDRWSKRFREERLAGFFCSRYSLCEAAIETGVSTQVNNEPPCERLAMAHRGSEIFFRKNFSGLNADKVRQGSPYDASRTGCTVYL